MFNNELQNLFEEFEAKIKSEDKLNPEKDDPNGKYNFYIPKIRDYFFVYLEKDMEQNGRKNDLQKYFQEYFNRKCLIDATMYYVENCKARGVSNENNEKRANAINDFIIAYKHFYDIVLKLRFNMFFLQTDDLFADIKTSLEKKGYVILDSEQFPAIQKEEYNFICKYYLNQNSLQDKQLQIWIILQLSFLFGLSFSTIRNLRTNDFDLKTRSLNILAKNKDEIITLDLPYSIFMNIDNHIEKSDLNDGDLFFFTRNFKNDKNQSKPITSSFLSEEFDTLKKQYLAQENHDDIVGNRFTHYGVIKYAISNMLQCNMNIPSILNLTGRDIKFILSCKPEKTLKSHEQSNYINSKLRSIDTFMKFNY